MWQAKYALAVPKNLGVGVNFRPCSEGYFLSGHPQSVKIYINWNPLLYLYTSTMFVDIPDIPEVRISNTQPELIMFYLNLNLKDAEGGCVLKQSFMRTFPRNQDVTVKLKSELIFIKFQYFFNVLADPKPICSTQTIPSMCEA